MSPSNEITSLLRDEAYLTLCRRSPAKARANGDANAIKSTQKTRLARIDLLEDRVKSTLNTKLREYLQTSSHEYRQGMAVLAAISAWEKEINPYCDSLLAFADELKTAGPALAASKGTLYLRFDSQAKAVSGLRPAAENVDRAGAKLETADKRLSHTVADTIYAEVSVFAPPFSEMVEWMKNLESRINVEALVEMQARETEVRSLLSNKLLLLRSRATMAREAVSDAQQDYFESYWDELRRHALTNYVKERDPDEVLDELTERYVSNDRGTFTDEPALLIA